MCPVSLGFKTPLDPSIIWRYMPLSKFYTFVQSSALWFAAASSFPDRFEARKPRPRQALGIGCGIDLECPRNSGRRYVDSQIGIANFFRELLDDEYERIRPEVACICWSQRGRDREHLRKIAKRPSRVDLHPRSRIHRLRERSHDQRALSCTDFLQAKRICR